MQGNGIEEKRLESDMQISQRGNEVVAWIVTSINNGIGIGLDNLHQGKIQQRNPQCLGFTFFPEIDSAYRTHYCQRC